MLRQRLSPTVSTSKESMNSTTTLQGNGYDNATTNSTYLQNIKSLSGNFPHLESLSLYMQAIELARLDRRLGSHDSDSILAAEVTRGGVTYHRIDAYNVEAVTLNHNILSGRHGMDEFVSARILIVEDVSPAAIETLGQNFNIDPHVFYFHLGFDTRQSAMADLVDRNREIDIPVTWCMPSHAPKDFISIPVPCDLKRNNAVKVESGLQEDSTYSRQAYRPIAEIPGKENNPLTERAFHRISLIFAPGDVPTVIILAYPTWKRVLQRQSNVSKRPFPYALDSHGYTLDPDASSPNKASDDIVKKRGEWRLDQWERVRPLFNSVTNGLTGDSASNATSHNLRDNSLLWLYSVVNHNYFLACQNEGRCWRDIRDALDSNGIVGHISQRPKRQFRDSMTKTIELLEIAKSWLDDSLSHLSPDASASTSTSENKQRFASLKKRVEVTLTYERSRISQVLLNIRDYQSEVQMNLMVAQLEENRHAIQQAVSVGHLTKLAFIFVPLSTVCSAFGMNVREMDQHPTIWWFVGTSALCTLVATLVSTFIGGRLIKKRRELKIVQKQ